MKVRNIIIHFLVLTGTVFISFASILVYQTNPVAREMMEKVNPDINLEMLYRNSIFTLIYIIIVLYSFYFFMFTILLKKKLNINRVLVSVLVVFIFSFFQYLLHLLTNNQQVKLDMVKILTNSINVFLFGGIGLGLRSIIEYFNDKEKKKELQQKNLESEINLLRSQINPHFLFNTLNNIDAMIRKDPEKASDLLIKLSAQMRYMLYDSNTPFIDLKSEIGFIEDYIALQKLRIKNQQSVEFVKEGEIEKTKIPPMLFIPYIENVFKHCSNFEEDKSVSIKISVKNNSITFIAQNMCATATDEPENGAGGIGIELAQKRLELLFPGKYKIEVNKSNQLYNMKLLIDNGPSSINQGRL